MTLEFGTGYIPDLPDIRDFTLTSLQEELPEQVLDAEIVLPPKIDNRKWCSPIANQGSQGSCTGHSAVALFEYMQRKAKNRHVDGSPAFVYYNSRLNGGFPVSQDTGSYIRSTIQAICEDGVAEEKRFPYDQTKWSVKPSEEVYRKALNFKGTKYLRVDDGTPDLIKRMKSLVNTGYAINFGFAVYDCMKDITAQVPILPYPAKTEKQQGGHAVIIVGYDDDAPSRNRRDGNATKGAFLIQNSWGTGWGQKGFFYMPYKYFETGLALDVWTINDIQWLDLPAFK
jgi:C1A family cysteine protease